MTSPVFADHLLVALITLGLPVFALYIWHRRLLRAAPGDRGTVRLGTYRTVMLASWSLTIAVLVWWSGTGRGWSALGLGFDAGLGFWTAAALAAAAIVFGTWQRIHVPGDPESEEAVLRQIENVEPLLPRTPLEMQWFTAVSLTAGICEEILYRGFLIAYAAALVPKPAAVVVASLLFGMGHAYQGSRGVAQTGLVGLGLALLYLLGGSLWIPMAVHAFIDWNSGTLVYTVFRRRKAAGEPETPPWAGDGPEDAPGP